MLQLKTAYMYYLIVSMGQEFRHGLARFSTSGSHQVSTKVLAGLHSRLEVGQSEESTFRPTRVAGRLQFLQDNFYRTEALCSASLLKLSATWVPPQAVHTWVLASSKPEGERVQDC